MLKNPEYTEEKVFPRHLTEEEKNLPSMDLMHQEYVIMIEMDGERKLVRTNARLNQIRTCIEFVQTLEEYDFYKLKKVLKDTTGCKFDTITNDIVEVFKL